MDTITTDESDRHVLLDEGSFATAVRPYWADMTRLAAALAPHGQWEDVLQESLAVAWRKRASFDRSRGTIRIWLLMIVADQARKGVRRIRVHAELVDVPDRAESPDRDLDLSQALTRLTSRQRLAIALYYFAGMPVAEIASAMSCSTGTVKSTLADARTRLRHELGEDYRYA